MGCSIPVGENSEQPIPAEPVPARRAAVLGSPVAHSRSPQLHLAAYRALGLADWTYDRIECSADQLPSVVSAFGPEWVGVSVTMPGKFAALRFATERTERAELVGSANTLVRVPSGWRADNTDIDGVAGALGNRDDLRRAIILGSGGTAPSAVVALAGLGVTEITVAARRADRVPASYPGGTAAKAVAIAVRDRGDGIAAEHIPRLTERFYRVDTARSRDLGGTGLGLAIVKHIVSRHRGTMTVHSTPGEGSVFTVYVPVSEPAAPARSVSAA